MLFLNLTIAKPNNGKHIFNCGDHFESLVMLGVGKTEYAAQI